MNNTRYRVLDLLRGLMLVVMTIDHLDLYGPVYRWTFETFGYASAAEGFVLLSGVVAGVVYSRAAAAGLLRPRLIHRVRLLVLAHLVTVVGLLIARLAGVQETPDGGGALAALVQALGGALLLNQEPPLDILPLYLFFLILLPLALRGFRTGRQWVVLGVSGAVWLLDQAISASGRYPEALTVPAGDVVIHWWSNSFHLLAWQFLFVVGAWAGWRAAAKRPLQAGPRSRLAFVLAVVLTAVLGALRHGVILPEVSAGLLATSRQNLGWLRLLNVALLAWLIRWVVLARPAWGHQRWLELLGRHALMVYVWQVGLQLWFQPWYTTWTAGRGLPVHLALLALAVASLTVPAWWRERQRQTVADIQK